MNTTDLANLIRPFADRYQLELAVTDAEIVIDKTITIQPAEIEILRRDLNGSRIELGAGFLVYAAETEFEPDLPPQTSIVNFGALESPYEAAEVALTAYFAHAISNAILVTSEALAPKEPEPEIPF